MEVKVANSFFDSIKRMGSIGHKWRSFKCWCRYHFNKDYFNILKETLKGYPWDHSFLLRLEKVKLLEMIHYHEKTQRFVGWEYIVRDMKICVSLLEIMLEEMPLFHYNGNILFEKLMDCKDEYEIKHTEDFAYVCDVKVNTQNVDRFEPNVDYQKYLLKHPHELYIKKAKYLYHKIRFEKEDYWWD